MAFPVTIAGEFTCSHAGVRTPATTEAKLTVGKQAVLLFSDAATPAAYVGCSFPQGGPPKPCQTTSPAAAPNPGSARKLTVDGHPVLLDALHAATENPPSTPPPDPANTVTVAAGQDKLTAS
ncbi:hypothetical protein ACWEVP_01375 [Amycolatopsis sp. NPDC003865]